jgi:hypothetical protein
MSHLDQPESSESRDVRYVSNKKTSDDFPISVHVIAVDDGFGIAHTPAMGSKYQSKNPVSDYDTFVEAQKALAGKKKQIKQFSFPPSRGFLRGSPFYFARHTTSVYDYFTIPHA